MLQRNLDKRNINIKYLGLALLCAICLVSAQAQTPPAPANPNALLQAPLPKLGPTADSIPTTYRKSNPDPFFDKELLPKRKEEVKPKVVAIPIEVVAPPEFEEREAAWKERRDEARRSGRPEPASTEKFLIEEMDIRGVYKKSDGQGVFMRPKVASKTVLFATIGQKFWDGEIKQIDGNQIVFEVVTKYNNNTSKSEPKTLRYTRGK
jgi:hypothetical protein